MRELKRSRKFENGKALESFESDIFPDDDSYSKIDFDSDFRWLHRAFTSNLGTLEDRLGIETKEDIEFLIGYMERMLKKIDSFDIAGKEHLRQDLYSQIEELNELYKEYVNNMDKKLEARVARLEKALKVKNEMKDPARIKADAVSRALASTQSNMHDLISYIEAVNGKGIFDYSDEVKNAILQAKNLVSQAENILLDIYPEL